MTFKASKRSLAGLAILTTVLINIAITQYTDQENFSAPLNHEQIKALLVGNTLKGNSNNSDYSFFYSPDGVLLGNVGSYSDRGNWSVNDNHYCTQWRLWGHGEKLCWTLRRRGNEIKRESYGDEKDTEVAVINKLIWHQGNVDNR